MKQKRYWLRGGLSLFILTTILGLMDYRCSAHTTGWFDCLPYELPRIILSPFNGLIKFQDYSLDSVQVILTILTIALWTIAGMVLGLIYGKFKNRNMVR